ncbi:orotidine-5'-phosphate decarboxylase [Corynebacterium jeikeium]|uniref:orotidine-5'-phosphate decarboxylase n=1 Tax=Corynebacterium jeikeium TaxID=38289 RepID=UPI0001B71A73|nr:orotidine-5'-phosphate decarboxylase [Corynebacterium jeikeium]EEW16361.1 orotidine 5'-phosphate decarboxylase [Corynebacterium jeikeium ATCC 43734]OOD34027.1 orotidine 5'-phosphate decarboxylase [Corynebacterium jeikeium]WCZ53574.1 orotidine 5'-phosphate decarboxylase [Corynebacterium jeikeium]SUY81115.1 orotidine 5'-phosphate decarboxylase [Corynebacterium jeikeium]
MTARPTGLPTFGQRFLERSEEFGQLCVGMDPHVGILEAWGLKADVAGLEEFSKTCVEAFADVACVVKPQVAFYEQFGSAGLAVLERSISELRKAGVLVIADAKRGDIGSTMAGYARAWLDPESPLCSDAVTVSPWLGFDSLRPVIDLGERYGRGVIVLAATSNPEARSLQRSFFDDTDTNLAQYIVDRVAAENAQHSGAGNLGVVVGATLAEPPRLDQVGGMVLMPGVGAQGGTMDDVLRIAGGDQTASLVSPNVSRGVLRAGPNPADLRNAVAEQAATLRL